MPSTRLLVSCGQPCLQGLQSACDNSCLTSQLSFVWMPRGLTRPCGSSGPLCVCECVWPCVCGHVWPCVWGRVCVAVCVWPCVCGRVCVAVCVWPCLPQTTLGLQGSQTDMQALAHSKSQMKCNLAILVMPAHITDSQTQLACDCARLDSSTLSHTRCNSCLQVCRLST